MINRSTHPGVAMFAGVVLLVLQPASAWRATAADIGAQAMAKLVGQPADIASSAYQYRADRKAEQNPPESWLAVMRLAGQPLNKPADTSAPAVRRVLCALLWEEIRPVKKLELSWAADAKRRPVPEELTITTLDNQGSASSWWNNLLAAQQPLKPLVSGDGNTYLYALPAATCGMVISVSGAKTAADYDVPQVRVLVADAWKKMTVEIEWGFDQTTAGKDYGGRIEIYDGRVAGLRPLAGDRRTTVAGAGAWRSAGKGAARRGMKFDLLYMGTSQWRKVQPFTSQRDDVARTIVTLWTKAGNFSFLPADLENGPILAPEYGFLVKASAPRIQANAEWMLRQRRFLADSIPGGERLWCKGLQPAHQATPDSGGLFLQWYWSEALYCASVSRWAATLGEIDPDQGTKLAAEAEADRKDFLTAA